MSELKGKRGIAAYLKERVGQIVHTKELYEASGRQSEYTRRIRELRDEDGWRIETRRDADDLRPDEYRLAEPPPEKSHMRFQRNINAKLRAQVLDRNGFTCQMCGVAAGDVDANGRRAVLEVGHIRPKTEGGKDELNNLRALCSVCNQGAKNIVMMPPERKWLLGQVRRANDEDQRAVLEWLRRKFRE